ncbi:hypothetical protein CRYUN_Cryun19dG0114400 [Craigia yunnanensis]
MGENNSGLTEKVVLSRGRLYALKRFRKVIVGKSEFGRRVERLAQVCKKSEYLAPITAYLYAKRIKLVLCDCYPMGSLADLLADYGFVQLAACVEDPDKDRPGTSYSENLSQKSDIFNFGLVLLHMLAGEPGFIKCILDTKESIKQGKSTFFEFHVQGKERKQALKALDTALACTNRLPEARPSIQQILLNLSDILNSTNK